MSGHQPVFTESLGQVVNSGAQLPYLTVCPSGKKAVGGGYEFNGGGGPQLTAVSSHPSDAAGTGWRVVVRNNTANPVTANIRVHAVCAIVP